MHVVHPNSQTIVAGMEGQRCGNADVGTSFYYVFIDYLADKGGIAQVSVNGETMEVAFFSRSTVGASFFFGQGEAERELGIDGDFRRVYAPFAFGGQLRFFVQLAEGSTDNTVKFTADMQKFETTAAGGAETQAFTITADDGKAKSGAVLAYADNAENAFNAAEDARLMRNLLGNNANELSVYTVAGDKAASVNQVKDLQQIPLGLFAADGDVTTLTFTGTDALLEPSLYDAELNTDTPITEGMTLSVSGASHGRYFIRAKGAGSGSDGSTGVTDVTGGGNDVSVYSVEPCQVVVSSGAELMEVGVYSVGGSLLKRESVGGGSTSCKLYGVDSGVAVVRVVTADGTFTRKITVR